MAASNKPDFPVSASFGEFLARWRPSLERLDDIGQRTLGGVGLDLAWQISQVRHTMRGWETSQLHLLDEVFGMTSLLDGSRHGGALAELEDRIMDKLDEQDRKRDAARKAARRWLVTTIITLAGVIVGAMAIVIAKL